MKRYSPGRSVFRKRNQQENLYPKLEQFSNDGDDSNDGNVSYESDHGEDDSERDAKKLPILTVLEWIWNLFRRDISILVLLFLVLAIIIVSLGLIYSLSNPNSEGISLKKYKQQVNGILKKSFTNEYEHGVNTKAVLRLIGEKWIYEKPVEPYVVLITGTKAGMLADALGDVFSNVTGKGEIDRIFCNEYKERQLLESEVTKSLSKHSKSVVLHGIDTLRGYAPLYLHSLSDADHSPFRSSLIILTINSFFGSHPNCEDEISSHLLNVWDSGLYR